VHKQSYPVIPLGRLFSPTVIDKDTLSERSPTETGPQDDAFDRWRAQFARAFEKADSGHIDVYVRSLFPPIGAKATQTAAIEDFQAVTDSSAIDDVSVNVWGERICLCEQCRRIDAVTAALNTIREFEAWGEEYNATASPFFEHATVQSSILDAEHDSIVPPRVTAAVVLDGRLVGIFPAEFGDRSYSVAEFCAFLGEVSGVELPTERDLSAASGRRERRAVLASASGADVLVDPDESDDIRESPH